MFALLKKKRHERRQLLYRRRVARLCDVHTIPAMSRGGIVVTVMMTKKPDPQRGAPIAGDYLEYIRPWWTTVNKVGLNGVILHDGLPEELIARATTDCISFQLCELGELPILHQRHFAVRDYLQTSDAESVLVTDVSDVAVKRDPFELLANCHPGIKLMIGSETRTIGSSRCVRSELSRQYGSPEFTNRRIVNPGVLGGRREEVIRFLDLLTAEIRRLDGRLLASDMSIVNHVFHSHYDFSEVLTGAPLHSNFRKWDYNSSAAVMHK